MADEVSCPECSKKMDARGLPGHRRMSHGQETTAVADGGSSVVLDRNEVDQETEKAARDLPGTELTKDAVIIRRMELQETVVTDDEMKKELTEELKKQIREQNGSESR